MPRPRTAPAPCNTRGRRMRRPYGVGNYASVPNPCYKSTGVCRGEACLARARPRHRATHAGDACVAPTALETTQVSLTPATNLPAFVGARHASPIRSYEPAQRGGGRRRRMPAPFETTTGIDLQATARACSISALISLMCSMPMHRRIISGRTPADDCSSSVNWRCVVDAG